MKGEKFFHRAFRPCFIYNSCKSACQEQADFPPVLACLKSYCSRANWIKKTDGVNWETVKAIGFLYPNILDTLSNIFSGSSKRIKTSMLMHRQR